MYIQASRWPGKIEINNQIRQWNNVLNSMPLHFSKMMHVAENLPFGFLKKPSTCKLITRFWYHAKVRVN